MEKILLAIGSDKFESALSKELKNKYEVGGVVLRKGQLLSKIEVEKPDILVLIENLPGDEDIKKVVMDIRKKAPYVRIIFLAGKREIGDSFLSLLVSYGVWDIVYGGAVKVSQVLALIYSKNEYKDVSHLQPDVIFDRETVSFNMPETVNVQTKEVIINGSDVFDESKLRDEITKEVEMKFRAQLKNEYEKDFEIIKKMNSEDQTEEIKKLKKEYEDKLLDLTKKWESEIENIEKKAQEEVREAKRRAQEEVQAKEETLKVELEKKVKILMKKNKEMQDKYTPEVYEKKIRAKLEKDMHKELSKYKEDIRKSHNKSIENKTQEDLVEAQKKIIADIEAKSKKAIKEKDVKLAKLENKLRESEQRNQDKDKKLKQVVNEMEKCKEDLEKEREEFISKNGVVSSNQKIITVFSAKNGIGNTTIAVNVASELARKKKKVLLVEMNAYSPSIAYWYQLDNKVRGLEGAIRAVREERYRDVMENIITVEELKRGEYGRYYKKYPDTMDFLLFSQKETLLQTDKLNIKRNEIRDLFFYLVQDKGYDYVIVDLRIDNEVEVLESSILYSNKIIATTTQDISSIGYLQYRISSAEKNIGLDIMKKMTVVVNRYIDKKVSMDVKKIKEWLSVNKVITVGDWAIDIINANYDGCPACLTCKGFASEVSKIISELEK